MGAMIGRCHRILFAALLAAVLLPAVVAWVASAEDKAFRAASQEFSDKQYAQAEADFSAFLAAYSNSVHVAEAALCKAQAQMFQSNYAGAIQSLQAGLPRAGEQAPKFILCIAQSTNALGDHETAARIFGNLITQFPQSPLLLEAAYDQADAFSKLDNWLRVIELLGDTNAAFQRAARVASPGNEFAASGALLLSQAWLQQGRPDAGEAALARLAVTNLTAELTWERQLLLCKAKLAQGKTAEAESDSTNLLALADVLGPKRRAVSLAMCGEVFERENKFPEALQCYTNNLTDDLPAAVQRNALAKAVQLMFQQGQTNAAADLLQALAQRPAFGAPDLARLDLGEICLTELANHDTNAASLGTNLLERAATNFDSVIHDFPNSPVVGRAYLDFGWLCWTETNALGARTNVAAARAHFSQALSRLPHSEAQAVARFKLGDADLFDHLYSDARSNYDAVTADYRDLPSVTNKLFDLALYKILETSIALGDQPRAGDALSKILAWYPVSLFGGQGSLLLGDDNVRKGNYRVAREDFAKLTNNPAFRTSAEYAFARTFDLDGQWSNAIPLYEQWIASNPRDPLLAQVEYDRALACYRAGQTTNALSLMTNFVTRFASNNLAPWAQNWIADYYFNLPDAQGAQMAEKNYQELYLKWPAAEGDLAYYARFMAGKSALLRQDTREAISDYFVPLADDPHTPPGILSQAYYALGDAFFAQFLANPTNAAHLDHAIAALSKLTNGPSTNAMAPLAFGRLGDYYFQGNDFAGASQMYSNALACAPAIADETARAATSSQAEIGLGQIAYRQHRLDEALTHFDHALYNQTDPVWIAQAGQAAAQICEDQKHWEAAKKIYDRVLEAAPALRPTLEKKIAAVQRNMDSQQN